MKLKLSHEDLQIFLNELQGCSDVRFATEYESKLSGFILKELILSMMKKLMDVRVDHKINLDDKTLYVLNDVLPQIRNSKNDIYSDMVLREIYLQINQACLNI